MKQKLEFNKIIEKISTYIYNDSTRNLLNNINFQTNEKKINELLDETIQMKELLISEDSPPFGYIEDIEKIINRLKVKGSLIFLEELFAVRKSLDTIRLLKKFFSQITKYNLILNISSNISDLQEIRKHIESIINDKGNIKDNATKELKNIRNSINNLKKKIVSSFNKYFKEKSSAIRSEQIIEIDGRYMIPIIAREKKQVKGIEHYKSDTGQTIYIEPINIANDNNRLQELKRDEQIEITSILRDATKKIINNSEPILISFTQSIYLEFIYAKAQYSISINAVKPKISNNKYMSLINAKHPLLEDDAVPITIENGGNFNTLIISGSNTGGKTVTLKTAGLLSLMLQSGVPVSLSPDSELPIFDNIFCDIGDEQSIENSLSTFSAHIENIKHILTNSTASSLILLDEPGGGTSPEEGSALAESILLELNKRKAIVFAATHYDRIKKMPYRHNNFGNASVYFDDKKLIPTYKIIMNTSSGSNAFKIAKKLELDPEIINNAESIYEKSYDNNTKILEEKEIRIEQLSTQINKELTGIEKIKITLKDKEADLKEKEYYLNKEIRARADSIFSELKSHFENTIKQIKNSELDQIKIKELRSSIKSEQSKLNKLFPDVSPEKEYDFREGDTVRIKSINQTGIIVRINKNKNDALIQTDNLTTNFKIFELEKYTKKNSIKTQIHVPHGSENSINLIGFREAEIEKPLIDFLDSSVLSGKIEIQIIHGIGKQILRKRVRKILDSYPYKCEYSDAPISQGGKGVTIVKLEI